MTTVRELSTWLEQSLPRRRSERANVTVVVGVLYTVLSGLICLAFVWSARVGCLLPLLLLVVFGVVGEMLAGILSPLRRVE